MSIEAGRLHRRSIRLKGFDYTRCGAYFITMGTQDRLSLFGEIVGGEMHFSPFGNIASQQWQRLPTRFPHIGLDEFVLMPNHVRGIIVIYDDDLAPADLSSPRRGTAESLNDMARESSRRALTDSPTLLPLLPICRTPVRARRIVQSIMASIPPSVGARREGSPLLSFKRIAVGARRKGSHPLLFKRTAVPLPICQPSLPLPPIRRTPVRARRIVQSIMASNHPAVPQPIRPPSNNSANPSRVPSPPSSGPINPRSPTA